MKGFISLLFLSICLTAYGQAFSFRDVGFVGKRVAAASGPNTYYDVTTTTTGTATSMTQMRWCTVTVAQAGTATKIRLYINVFGGPCNMKVALYDSTGTTLLAQANGQSTTVAGYNEYAFVTPVSVSAANYLIAAMADTSNSGINRIGTGTRQDDTSALVYASFPPASVPSSTGNTGVLTCGVFVQ